MQHIKSLLTINGRAAVIVPDNVLFEGGAGEVIRFKLLHECDVHTLLRLPTGIFIPGAINQRQPTWSEQTPDGRWRCYELEDLLARDKISLDLFWLKDESLLDSDNLPEPDVIASEIAEDLRSVLEQMEEMLGDLEPACSPP